MDQVHHGLKVASYNIGATIGFTGSAANPFKMRLRVDMTDLAKAVDVICMQEVNDVWYREAISFLPES